MQKDDTITKVFKFCVATFAITSFVYVSGCQADKAKQVETKTIEIKEEKKVETPKETPIVSDSKTEIKAVEVKTEPVATSK